MEKQKYGTYGSIKFDKLWKVLEKKKKNKTWLNENGIHNNTISKLTKNENVSCEIIARLCYILDCKVNDILEYNKPE